MATANTVELVNGRSETTVADRISDGLWTAKVCVSSYLRPHPEDRRIPRDQLPCTVPTQWWAQVLGVKEDEVKQTLIGESSTTPKQYGYVSNEQGWTLTSEKPFVVVRFRDYDMGRGDKAKYWRGLTAARQMHKGELGQYPDMIRKPQIFPSTISDPENRRWDGDTDVSPKLNWVELGELAKISGLQPEEIIKGFAGFSPSTYYEPNVPLMCGRIQSGNMVRMYVGNVPMSGCGGELAWGGKNTASLDLFQQLIDRHNGKVSITQSFAYAVIRLTQFGYRPDNEAPQPSFRLEAPMPAAPQNTLPVLSVEELRELHELRQSLPKELSKAEFRQTAESAVGSTEWKKAPQMSDVLNGFAYYTDFEYLEAFDGRLVISNGYWTRAGANKSPNYYCGMIGVFPKRVADPRRDQSAILRLWLFPDELVRLMPAGQKGGVCPPSVPTDVAECMKRFLGGLGYKV
ncbi:MAG: hypothetical protein FJZ43_02925 [Candidatus Staskawiczbacteria bacterium]|nr:hypothetical protein [Candidatus Staskawiczbacteria bacterium]